MKGQLTCEHCAADVTDGDANLMVDSDWFLHHDRILWVKVLCKECTRKMTINGQGSSYHSLWELRSVREYPWHYIARVMADILREHRWTAEAIDNFADILIELLPEEDAQGFLQAFFAPEEWNGEGSRSARFRQIRGRHPE